MSVLINVHPLKLNKRVRTVLTVRVLPGFVRLI